jgi:pre-mRNA-splicing factor ATP-dependent RNA helicase DHX16
MLLGRQVMEIKPSWLLEGEVGMCPDYGLIADCPVVAPHYFKQADLEQLSQGEKKMPKVVGASPGVMRP